MFNEEEEDEEVELVTLLPPFLCGTAFDPEKSTLEFEECGKRDQFEEN